MSVATIMRPENSYKACRAFLKERGRTLKSLSVPEGMDLFFDFYRTVRSSGTSPGMGDGIFCMWEIYPPFKFSVARIFTSSDENPGPNGSRLRLSFCYSFIDVGVWVGRPDYSFNLGSTRFAWTVSDAERLFADIPAMEIYEALRDRPPKRVELRYEKIWDVR